MRSVVAKSVATQTIFPKSLATKAMAMDRRIGSGEIISCNRNGGFDKDNKFSGKMIFNNEYSVRMKSLVRKAVVGKSMAMA